MDWAVGLWGWGIYFSLLYYCQVNKSPSTYVSMCSCLTSSFSEEWHGAGPFGGNLGETQRRRCMRHALGGYQESRCLNERFKPCSAGTTVCWAPIVIRLGRLLFCLFLFLDLTNMFSNQTKSSQDKGKMLVQGPCYFSSPSHPIPSHPLPYCALFSPFSSHGK